MLVITAKLGRATAQSFSISPGAAFSRLAASSTFSPSVTENFTLPSMGDKVYLLAAAFAVLLLPALPFKQLMTAVYVRGLKE